MSKRSIYQTGLVEINHPGYSGVPLELRNQYYNNQSLPKKDKKKVTITNRLLSLEENFYEQKNEYYKSSLSDLQQDLSSTHSETNDLYLEKLRDSQERRDYELTRLRLWENYQVSKVEKEAREDVEKINEEYDTFIKIIKDKLYDKLTRKIRLLKEDKVLKDLANVNHYSIDIDLINNDSSNNNNGNNTGNGHGNDPKHHHFEDSSRNSPKKKLLSLTENGTAMNGLLSGFSDTNNSSNPLASRRGMRRTTRNTAVESSYNTDSNLSGNDSSMPGYYSSSSNNKRRRVQTARAAAAAGGLHNTRSYSSASNDEANFFSDNNSLSEILFGKHYSSSGGNKSSHGHGGAHGGGSGGNKNSSRTKQKQFTGVNGLKPEEVHDDLVILESVLEKSSQAQTIFTSDVLISNGSGSSSGKKR